MYAKKLYVTPCNNCTQNNQRTVATPPVDTTHTVALAAAGMATYEIGANVETIGTASGIAADILNENYASAAIKAIGSVMSLITGNKIEATKAKGADQLGTFVTKLGADVIISEGQKKVEGAQEKQKVKNDDH